MDEHIIKNHERYLSRISLFKEFGYDIVQERNFIIEKVQAIEGRILEIGTGKGHFTVALAQKGYHLTTVDISEEDQKFAQMNIQYLGLQNQVDFVIADAQHLHFIDDSYDISFGINIIHHLSEPLRVIDEFIRVTAFGGKIVISDFSKKGFSIIEKIHENEGSHHDSGQCTLNEVAEYSASQGLKIEKYHSQCQNLLIMHKRSN